MCLNVYEIESGEILIKVRTGDFKGFYVNESMHDVVMSHCNMFLSCEPFTGPWNNINNESFPHPFLEFIGQEDGLTFVIVFSRTDKPGCLKLLTVCEFDHKFSQMSALNYFNEEAKEDFREDPDNIFLHKAMNMDECQTNDKKWVIFFDDIICALTSKEKFFMEPIIDYFDD